MENSGSHPEVVVPPVEGFAGGGTAYGWSETGTRDSNLPTGSIDPLKVHSSELVHVWCMPSSANVGPQDMPRTLEPISLLAARNERENVQIAIRPKVSWAESSIAGTVQIQCADLCSTSGDRLVVGESLKVRRVVPILGIPDALVPLEVPLSQLTLFPGETSAIWVSIDVPNTQPPGQYEGEFIITATRADTEFTAQCLGKAERNQLYQELRSCLDFVEPIDGKSLDEVLERMKSASSSLRRVLLSPPFSDLYSDDGSVDMMDEDAISNLSVRVKISLTVWDFVLPATPSLPAVIGISDTVIEDRFGVEHGSSKWYEALDQHFKWLLQYKISPFFCRWRENMRVLTYTCPWPADHPKSDEYYSDPRLAAYAVPYSPIVSCGDTAEGFLQKEVEILRTKNHWRKAYFYLWDEPLNLEHYQAIRNMASEVHAYAPDARIMTTYYCGPSDAPLASNNFEAFLKVPEFLRPHTQLYCTSEWVIGNREDLAKDIIAEIQPENGEEWWTYVCMGPSDPQPNWHLGMRGTQHRAVMWRVWKEGGTGFLYWGANCYERATVPSAEIKFRRGLPPGDGVLYYPGQVFSSSHEPVASLRLERLLSGLQDIEYLKHYSSRFGREEGLNLLEKTGMYLGPERYTHDHMPIDIMRGEVFRTCQSQSNF
ncbi:hypothetical protein ABFS82_03G056700 [Erythranthe guttata]|uniref:Glycoside hydrolase 123 catalytic domain-containing protein n=1 Tax=Erythranthe guttata TaxID=4155 RepID=A0A022RYQ5_ERYGU|nr:PREDICTED: uncharacterized protein LOC105965838 [Erythranthe guttata]EYU45131.1 hypothetical protein MIMGU_mgv1a002605mg [Erythranthe guttata]|eukprot:XP_012845845.1 PREDICTED: uncharacterized protein LOC105965838 [Erythranthe guttata]